MLMLAYTVSIEDIRKTRIKRFSYGLSRALIFLLLLLPSAIFSQDTDEVVEQFSSPWEVDLSYYIHNLSGNGIDILPGELGNGSGFEGTAKYSKGQFGLGLSGGFWKASYLAQANNVQFTQRLENLSAHYIMFGPYYKYTKGKLAIEIHPKAGVQRLYFPHITGKTVNAGVPVSNIDHRTRTDFDAGVSAALGLRLGWKLDQNVTLNARVDYMTTVGDEAFKFSYRSPGQSVTNTDPLESLSIGLGASFALLSKSDHSKTKSLAPTGLDVSAGAGLNALVGKGISNLPGEKSIGYDANATINYRIGKSGVALKGGFWDNKYSSKDATTVGNAYQRLKNISAHYISVGPIIPIVPNKLPKMRVEVVPHIGIQRIYFPHSSLSGGPVNQRVRTNLESGWSAGLGANLSIPIDAKLDLKVGVDYTTMITDRSFGFTVSGLDAVTNRKPLERINAGVSLVYNILQKIEAVEDKVTPDEIAELINQKEDDMDTDTSKDGMDSGSDTNDENTNQPTEPTIETSPSTGFDSDGNPINPSNGNTNGTDPNNTDGSSIDNTNGNSSDGNMDSTTTPISPDLTTPSTETEAYQPNTVYRVQFVALSKDARVFNELKQYGTVILEYYATKGLYRYMVGDAPTEAEGNELLREVHRNGWPKAFLVKYQNGERTRIR